MFELPEDTPNYIKALPREERGYPIPFFVARLPDGTRDLRFADPKKKAVCLNRRICWVCGKSLNVVLAIVGGPLSAYNRKSGDMPCHPACAEFSAKYCPHLNRSQAKYRHNNTPPEASPTTGLIMAHPGVIGITYCTDLSVYQIRTPNGLDVLAQAEQIQRIDWWYEGRQVEADRAAELWKPSPEMLEQAPEMVDDVREFIQKTGAI